jgi:hypothetical protein
MALSEIKRKSMTTASTLKHWLVPHRGNRHQPRILGGASLTLIALALLALQLVYNFTVSGQWRVLSYASSISDGAVMELTNGERTRTGLPRLSENTALEKAARLKAEDMFRDDYWDHVAPDGTEPWYFFDTVDYEYSYAGENLAKNFDTSSGVVAGWMGSPGHRANILNEHYREIGIAVVNGVLLGEETTLVVALYGAPVEGALAAEPAAPQNPTPIAIVQDDSPTDSETVTVSADEPAAARELAPSVRDYSAVRPLLFTQTMGWGQLISLAMAGSLLPVYGMTHAQMLRHQLHHAAGWLWRRRLLELAGLIALIGGLMLGSWGSVG